MYEKELDFLNKNIDLIDNHQFWYLKQKLFKEYNNDVNNPKLRKFWSNILSIFYDPEVNIDPLDTELIGWFFFDKFKNYPSKIILTDRVKRLDKLCFYNCTGLESITFPDTIESIGESAFDWCFNLKEVILPKYFTMSNEIAANTFGWCTSLTNIIIPANVKYIRHHAFAGCKSLTNVTLSDDLKWIADEAFYKCTSLESIIIPDNIKNIHINAFEGCTNLKQFIYRDNVYSNSSDLIMAINNTNKGI